MATVTTFNTFNSAGIDVNVIYTNTASLTPETPSPPFQIGTQIFGANGAEYIFAQASTAVNAYDWVVLGNNGQANSMTSVNLTSTSSIGSRIAVAPKVSCPVGAYFWAQTRGASVIGNTLVAPSNSNANLQMFSSLTAGAVASVTSTSSVALGGIEFVLSATTCQATFYLTWPRVVQLSGVSTPVGALGFNP